MDESAENLSRIKSNTEAGGPVRRTEDKRNEETSDESIFLDFSLNLLILVSSALRAGR